MIRLSAYCLFSFFFLNKFLLKWHLSANLAGPRNVVNARDRRPCLPWSPVRGGRPGAALPSVRRSLREPHRERAGVPVKETLVTTSHRSRL